MIAEIAVGDMGEEMDKAQNQPQHKHRGNEEVEQRIEAGVIGEGLRLLFSHDESSDKQGKCSRAGPGPSDIRKRGRRKLR